MLHPGLQSQPPDHLRPIQDSLKPGWSVHIAADDRLFYFNAGNGSTSWIPPVEAWSRELGRGLPYGWEEAVDSQGRLYYINHVNKTTTYEEPVLDWLEEPPQPRQVTLTRDPELGFGFVAGSERPVIVRFVTEGGPSEGKLLPGDQILEVNSEDVSRAPRDHVIHLVRASKSSVVLLVSQPVLTNSLRKSAILSSAKKAKLKSNPSRVRFAEGVVVNGAPLSLGCVLSGGGEWSALPNVLKVFLENGQTKSFKYDASTTVGDVLDSLVSKLCFKESSHFALVLEQVKTLKRNKLTLLNPNHTLARIASRPGTHNLRCLFRVAFVPNDPCDLAQKDLSAFEYFYLQCCNDVVQERYAPELKYDTALRLAALHIHQHCLVNNIQPSKITVKGVEKEFGLEKFVPTSLLETMKRKELRKVLTHLLKLNYTMTGTNHKCLTALQAKLYYLTIISQLPSYGAKCFPTTNSMDANIENVLLVSPKLGIGQINGLGSTNVPIPVAEIEHLSLVQVDKKDHLLSTVTLVIPTSDEKQEVVVTLDERDAEELVLVLQGYFRLLTEKDLTVQQEVDDWDKDSAPLYHSQHAVKPAIWSYGAHVEEEAHRIANLAMPPPALHYANQNGKFMGSYSLTRNGGLYTPNGINGGVDSNMNVPGKVKDRNGLKMMSPGNTGIDLHSVLSMEILEQDGHYNKYSSDVVRRVAEMQALVNNSEEYLSRHQRENSDSDTSHKSQDSEAPPPGPLKHSDSLLLITQSKGEFSESVTEALNTLDLAETESESDSLTTSPSHNSLVRTNERDSGSSFGLHSPDNLVSTSAYEALQEVWRRMREDPNQDISHPICLDPDIIDLTLLPPPITPDKDVSMDLLSLDLEEFLATTQVAPPPPIAVDPSLNLTTEQISAFIIPPPPAKEDEVEEDNCKEEIIVEQQSEEERKEEEEAVDGPSLTNGSLEGDIPERPPKIVHKTPPPLPPRSDSFNKKQFFKEADVGVEAIKVTTDFSDKLSLSIALAERNVNNNQEVKDMLGLELRRLVTSSKLLVRSHKCSNVASPESGDYAGNVHCVLSQLRKAVDYGSVMEQRFLLGVLQVVTQLQAIVVAESLDDLTMAAEKLANILAQLIKDCQSS